MLHIVTCLEVKLTLTLRLQDKRVVVTQAGEFMGPAVCELFSDEGAHVIANYGDLQEPQAANDLITDSGQVDILVANFMSRNRRHAVHSIADDEWQDMFDAMVHPLHRLVRAVLPQMIVRRSGKIIVMGSANAIRGTSVRSAYSAARGAQLAYVRAVGIEVAEHNININAIAQNFVSNPTSYTAEILASANFAARLKDVPIGRPALGWESAALALYLSTADSNFVYGQVFPFSGGWMT